MPETFKELLISKLNDIQGYHLIPFIGVIFVMSLMTILVIEGQNRKNMYIQCLTMTNSVTECTRILEN